MKSYLNDMTCINELQFTLLSDFLDYNKLENKEFKLLKKNSKIQDIFNEVKNIFLPRLQEKNNTLEMINESQKETFFNDPNRAKQLLMNFISNANKFTENGHIIIKIEDYQHYLSIVVQDSGVGMSPEILEMISQDVITHCNSEN